jgi:hypothetical protein
MSVLDIMQVMHDSERCFGSEYRPVSASNIGSDADLTMKSDLAAGQRIAAASIFDFPRILHGAAAVMQKDIWRKHMISTACRRNPIGAVNKYAAEPMLDACWGQLQRRVTIKV